MRTSILYYEVAEDDSYIWTCPFCKQDYKTWDIPEDCRWCEVELSGLEQIERIKPDWTGETVQ